MIRDFEYCVAIPTRDRPNELKQCLKCVMKQKIKPRKIIIVDDGDICPDKLCSELDLTEDLIIYHKKEITGMVRSYNIAMDLCPSEWLLFLDDDIYIYEDFMERMLEAILSYSGSKPLAGVAGYPQPPMKEGIFLGQRIRMMLEHVFLLSGGKEGLFLGSGFCTDYSRGYHPPDVYAVEHVPGGTGLWRTDIIRKYRHDKKYGEQYALGSDKDMAYRISRKFRLLCQPRAMAIHQKSPQGRMSRYRFGKMMIRNQYTFFKESFCKKRFSRILFYWALFGEIVLYFFGAVFSGNYKGRIFEVRGMLDEVWRQIMKGVHK